VPGQIVGDAPEAASDGGWIKVAGVIRGQNDRAFRNGVGPLSADSVEDFKKGEGYFFCEEDFNICSTPEIAVSSKDYQITVKYNSYTCSFPAQSDVLDSILKRFKVPSD
jgi:hypothetical protein